MNIKRSLLVVGAVSSIGAAGIGGNALVSAAQSNSQGGNETSSLVTKLAQKFNLKTEDVQAVFDADKSAKDTERTAKVDTELTKAVTDGKLTNDQKAKILAKRAEVQAARESQRDAIKKDDDATTKEQRKTAMDAERTALDKWASDNGIPADYVKYVHGGPGGGGHGGPMGR